MAAAFVASASTRFTGGSGPTETVAITPGAAAHLLVIGVAWSAGTGASITDISGNGNTYVLVQATTDGANAAMSIYSVKSAATGATTISVTWGADPGFGALVVHEASGTDTTSDFDQKAILAAADPGTGADAFTSGNVTPSTNGQYLFGMVFDDGGSADTWTKGTGWDAIRQPAGTDFWTSEDKVQVTAAAIAATFTVGVDTFARTIVGIATFKAAAAGGRGLFRTPQMAGIGIGGSFFRDPLQGRAFARRDHIYVPTRMVA